MSEPARKDSSFKSLLSELRHEMRTPIGHIIGYAEMIEEDLGEEKAKMFSGDLEAIQNAGHKMLGLIDQHFNTAKNSADEINFADAQFQLRLQLNHISGYTEMLREDSIEDGFDAILGDLDHIASAQASVLRMIEQIGAHFERTGAAKGAAAKAETAVVEPQAPSSIFGVGGEILIVDDDPANRELLARRLARSGYSSNCVDSGETALKQLEKRRYDLILLDQKMPGMSGLETLEVIQSSARLRTIPVIMLSAADDSHLMVQCILHGAEDYVAKPFNPILLTARINACLEKVRLRQNIAQQLRVFISSPGDVIPERLICKTVINRLNDEFSGKAYLVPILWEEEPLLASDTFQAQIHPPHETDIYIAIFWSRIGSPLPDTITREDGSIYESGSVFEFEDALAGFRENGHPEMLLYRKGGAPQLSLADKTMVLERLEQMDRLQNYVERVLIGEDGSYAAAFHMFDDGIAFEAMLEIHLRKLVERIVMKSENTG
jgi:CheY-like chemotaxis protein